jgi:GMP synthase-like glutamine amidotransferase
MILLIQNGYFTPGIIKYLREDFSVIKSFETNVTDININNYALVIILGGNQSLTNINSYPYLQNVVQLINKCLSINKPLIGICLGAQLITFALGCEIKSCQKNNIGYDVTIMSYSNVFRYHFDFIVPNNSINILEYFEDMPYLYKYGLNVYGIQCHPDIIPEQIHNYTTDESIIRFAQENKDSINQNNFDIINKLIEFVIKN